MGGSLSRQAKRGYFKLLRLLFYSSDGPNKVAMGAAFGLFWGLTPTVGVQITGLGLQAAITYLLNKWTRGALSFLDFSLPLSIALTWISNPFTMLPLYFLYYYIGALVLPGYAAMGWSEFSALLLPLTEVSGMLGSLGHLGEYFADLGQLLLSIGDQVLIPLIFGSLLMAIPISCGGYVWIRHVVSKKMREKQARLDRIKG